MAELTAQIKELPNLKYLFVSSTDTTDIQDEYDLDDDDNDPVHDEQVENNETDEANTNIVQDDQEEAISSEQMKRSLSKKLPMK